MKVGWRKVGRHGKGRVFHVKVPSDDRTSVLINKVMRFGWGPKVKLSK